MRRTAMLLLAVMAAAAVPLTADPHRPGSGDAGPAEARIAPAVLAAASAAAGAPAAAHPEATAAPAPTLDLVLSLERPAGPDLRRRLERLGTWWRAFERIPVAAVRLPADRLDALRGLPGVRAVRLNDTLGYFLEDSARLLDAPRVWHDLGVTGAGVTVAVIDSGVDFTHPDLAPALAANVKLAGFGGPLPSQSVEGTPNSDTTAGHGTHVAGDVAGRGLASDGAYRGIAPGAGLVGLGVGDGLTLNLLTVVEAYEWILEHKDAHHIRVVNNSFGSSFEPFDPEHPVNLATRAAADAGLVVVFANGNDGDEMSMNPAAAAPWVLGVGAETKEAGVAGFSSAGIEADQAGLAFAGAESDGDDRGPLHMGRYHPAFLAPGDGVVSTRAAATALPLLGAPRDASLPPERIARYTTMSGTSMAAPEAAGVVALVLEADPGLSPTDVRRVLQTTARPIPGEPFHRQGYGRLDAGAAVELALSLRALPRPEMARRLEERQAARDAEVLAGLDHPTRTASWAGTEPDGDGTIRHQLTVAPGTARLKVVTNGVSVPFVGLVERGVVLRDAAGTEVARVADAAASGTTVLDVDLRAGTGAGPGTGTGTVTVPAYDTLAWGPWTIEIGGAGEPAPAQAFTFEVATVAATFAPAPVPVCRPVLGDVRSRAWRFQDDQAAAVGPYPLDPEFSYVGPVRGGTLGERSPERRLAGTFGGGTGAATGAPVFATAPLGEPLSVSGTATVDVWLQGPSEAVQGVLYAELLDVAPDGTETLVAASSDEDVGHAEVSSPQASSVPVPITGIVTVPAGHRLGVRLSLSFIGTGAHTLLYDSDRYASGLTLFAGTPGQECTP